MAICDWCKEEMDREIPLDSCKGNLFVEFADGEKLPPSTEHYGENDGRCHQCHVKHGNPHHPGCPAERCPRCGRQLISCDCVLA